MQNNRLFEWIKLKYHRDRRGTLFAIQEKGTEENALPIKIKRIFVLKDLNPKETRGNHALRKTTQIIFCLQGKCNIEMTNGVSHKIVHLKKFNQGILIYPKVWRVLKNFSKDTILLVIADKKYEEKDYIRNYEDFIQQIR